MKSAKEELEDIRLHTKELFDSFQDKISSNQGNTELEWPFLFDSGDQGIWKVPEEMVPNPDAWYFLGDIHGDFFALHQITSHIMNETPDWRIVLLGDVMDRGIHSWECFVYLLKLAFEYPERIIWIAGNHDICFSYDESQKCFESSVRPSEFLDFLNREDSMISYRREWGMFFMELASRLPRAVLFPNGLMATHGGFPHDDHQQKLKEMTADEKWNYLNTEACLQDFTWTRIHRNPLKRVNRISKGCQYGFKNFERFCESVSDVFPVKNLINGHEHPREGYDTQEKYKVNRALTLRSFGFDTIHSGLHAYKLYLDKLYFARGVSSDLPELISIDYDKEQLESLYPAEAEIFYRLYPELSPPVIPSEEVDSEPEAPEVKTPEI